LAGAAGDPETADRGTRAHRAKRQLRDELQGISDQWLARKNTREKSFSLGSPGGLATPFALGHVAALVNGGLSGVVTK
jgi:hypothetical protein